MKSAVCEVVVLSGANTENACVAVVARTLPEESMTRAIQDWGDAEKSEVACAMVTPVSVPVAVGAMVRS